MDEVQKKKMQWILFWVLLFLYVIVTVLTIMALFFKTFSIAPNFESTLVTTFIVEIAVGIFALFYSLFGLKGEKKEPAAPKVETESAHNVEQVTDSPLPGTIELNKPVDLGPSYNAKIRQLLGNAGFAGRFSPIMNVFASTDAEYTIFRPNVVIQVEDNPLIKLNMTLADYMDSTFSQTSAMLNIAGKRQVRTGTAVATQWYDCVINDSRGKEQVRFTQFQKHVVSGKLMGVITISYSQDTKPEDISSLQQLLNEFGLA